MLMVIFGAGASFDSAQSSRIQVVGGAIRYDGLPYRPPLANDLFADRNRAFAAHIRAYPKMHAILPLLRERSQKSVEEVLESLQSEAGAYPERHRQLAAVRFYLRDLLWECTDQWIDHTSGVTNYSPLIDQILRWHGTKEPIALVTFNYDLLLENALRSFGFYWSPPERFLESHEITGLNLSIGLMRVLAPLHLSIRLRRLSLLAHSSPPLGVKMRKRVSSCFPPSRYQSRVRTRARLHAPLIILSP